MKSSLLLLVALSLCVPVAILAQPQTKVSDANTEAFLVVGKEYHIHLPDDRNPFIYRFTETAQATESSADGRITDERRVPVTVTIRSDIFRILRLEGNSWALVEHPLKPTDYAAWQGKHRSVYHLQEPTKLSKEQLEHVSEAANREIKLTKTWLNLGQVITIKPVTEESLTQ